MPWKRDAKGRQYDLAREKALWEVTTKADRLVSRREYAQALRVYDCFLKELEEAEFGSSQLAQQIREARQRTADEAGRIASGEEIPPSVPARIALIVVVIPIAILAGSSGVLGIFFLIVGKMAIGLAGLGCFLVLGLLLERLLQRSRSRKHT